tara:strand:- start:9240 stop:17438 length:8199 start_codon:yes stop_codon:yes gene_type:complete
MVFVKGVGNVEFFDSLDGELAVDDEGKFYTKFPDYASTMPPAVTPYSEEDAEEAHGGLLGSVESHRFDRFLGRRESGSASYVETSEAGDRGFGDGKVEHLKPTDTTLERIESGELDEGVALRSTPGWGSKWSEKRRETAYFPESVKTSEWSPGRFAGSGGLTDEELWAMSVTRSKDIATKNGTAPREGDEGYDIWVEEDEKVRPIAERAYQKVGGDAEDAAKAGMDLADYREDRRLQREAEGRSEGMGWVAPVYYGFEDLSNTLLQGGYRLASTVEWIGGDMGLDEHANELQRMRNLEERVRGKGREGRGETYAERTYRQAGTELTKYIAVGLTAGAVTWNPKAAEGAVMAFAASESFNQQYVESIDQGHGKAEATMHGAVKAGITAGTMYAGNKIGGKLGMGPMDFAGVNIARRLIGKEAADTALDLSTKKLSQSVVDFTFSVAKGGVGEVLEETADMTMGMVYDRFAYHLADRELGAGAEDNQGEVWLDSFMQLLGPSLAGGGAGKLMPGGEAYDNARSGARVIRELVDESYRNMENEMVGRRQANRDIAKRLGIISKDERGVGYDELHRTILSNLKSTDQDVREGTIQALKDLEDMRLPKKPSRKDFTDKTGRKESSRSQREGYDQEVATVLRHGEAFEHIFEERSYEEVMEDILATHPDLVEEYAERKAAIKESEDAVERREQLLEELEVMQVEDPDLADSLRESALAHVKETAPSQEAQEAAVSPEVQAIDDDISGLEQQLEILKSAEASGEALAVPPNLSGDNRVDIPKIEQEIADLKQRRAALVKEAATARPASKPTPKTKKASAGVDLTIQEQIKQQARPVTKATEHRDDILAIQKAIPGAQIEQVAISGEGTPSGGFRAYRWRLMPGRKKKGEKLKENTGIVMWVDEETLAYRGESRALREEVGLPTQRLANFKLNTGRITLDGLGVVRLSAALEGEGKQTVVDGRAVPMGIDKALRHELVHLARAAGLFTDKEWSGFVKKYSDPSKSELDQEEDIALASALWEQDSGFRNGLKQFLRKIIEAIRGLGGRESSQAIKDEVAATEQAFLAGEVLKRNRIAEDSELIALWRNKLGLVREEGKRIVEEMPEDTPASDIPTEVIVDAAADVVAGRDPHPKVQKKMSEEPEVMEARIENVAEEMSDPSPEPEATDAPFDVETMEDLLASGSYLHPRANLDKKPPKRRRGSSSRNFHAEIMDMLTRGRETGEAIEKGFPNAARKMRSAGFEPQEVVDYVNHQRAAGRSQHDWEAVPYDTHPDFDDSVGMAEYAPRRKVKGQSKSTQNKHALEPRLRVTTRHKKIGKKRFLQKTTNKNAPNMLAELSPLLDRHKTPEESEAAWNSMMVDAYGSNDIPVAPRKLISDLRSGEAARLISSLTDGQLAEANIGFKNAAEFRDAYLDGRVSVEQTGKLFLWSFLSRGVSPYTQESLFLNAWGGVDRWIKAAADGTLEARKDDYEAWAKSVAPKDMGIPGAGATHNLNAFGHAFLVKMSQDSGDGRSNLQLLHDMMSDPDSTGTEIRRVFQRIGEGVGIDNKVVSFTLLVAGYTDLMVIDRVQLRHLWDDGTFEGINLWDGDKINKQTVTGSSLASITYGVRGLVVYEAIERAVRARVQEIYNQAGRPQDASVGRYHWESWVAASQQEASHATLHAILSDIRGEANPTSGLMAREGDYGQLSFSARYGVDDNGGYILYNPPGGDLYRFTLGDWAAFRSEVAKRGKTKVLPPGFIIGYKQIQSKRRLTEEESYLAAMPWYERPGVNKEKLKQEAMKYGTPVRETTEDVRAVDGTAVGGKAVSHRPSADQPGPPGSRQSATTRGRADLQQEDSVALMGFDSVADMLRAGVKFFSGSKPEKAAESEPARPSRTPSSPPPIPTVSEGERIVGDTHVSPGGTPETKEEIARVQRRISIPVHDTTFTEEMAAEDARIDGDYDGELAKMLAEIDTVRAEVESGIGSMAKLTESAEKNFRFQALMEEATRRMIAAKSGDGWTDGGQAYDILERLTLAYAEGGSEQGRAFASRRAIDPSLSPAARREKELLAIVASLIKEKASKNPGKSKNATDVLNKLAKQDFDINDIAGIAADPMRSIEFLNQMRAASASWGDGLYEYWRNSLLSGFQTQAVNMAGTAGFMSYVSMFERAVAAAAGTAARPFHSALGTKTGYDAATFREFGWMFHGMGDAFKNAFRNASMTWRAERSEFDTLNNQSHRVRDYYSGQKGGAIAAGSPKISGDLGKWVRLIGFRPAAAVDDLLKTLAQHFETNALAARIAAVDTGQKWGSPEFLEVFNEQLLHPNSMARRLATERAMTGAFQGDEGILMRGSAGKLSQKLHESGVGRWFHPFHKTPLNITDEALKRAPVLGFVVDVMDYRNRKIKREAAGKPFKGFAEDGLTDSLARQAVALTVAALLLSMHDEEDPWLTGAQGGIDTKKRQLAYASGYAPMTMGVGGGYRVSYARIEPVATVLGAFIDIKSSWARGEDVGTMAVAPISSAFNQLSDKTFLRGMSDMVQLYENIGKEDGGGMNALANFGANFASTWVPNMHRQASREYGGTIDETKLWGKGSVLKTLQRAGQKAELPFVAPPWPRYDQWGRPLTRRPFGRSPITDVGYGVLRAANPARVYSMDQATKVDLALYKYNAQRPADERIYLTTPSKRYTDFYGEKHHLNDAQWAQYQKYVGTYAFKSIDGLGWIDPENPTTAQMEELKSLYRKAAKAIKDRLLPQWTRGEDGSIPALD